MFSEDSHFQRTRESVKSGSKAWGRLLSNLLLQACVLVRVSVAVLKHRDQSKSGRDGLILLPLPHHSPYQRKWRGQGPKPGENLEAGADPKACYRGVPQSDSCLTALSAYFLRAPSSSRPEWYHPHGLGPPPSIDRSSIKKRLHRLASRPVFWRHLLSWGPLLSDGFGLYQVDMKPSNTEGDSMCGPSENLLLLIAGRGKGQELGKCVMAADPTGSQKALNSLLWHALLGRYHYLPCVNEPLGKWMRWRLK